MPVVVGISFKKVGKVYYFDPNGLDLREGDYVIAATSRGIEFGEVMCEPKEVGEDELVEVTPKSIRLRKAVLDPHERKRISRAKEAAA